MTDVICLKGVTFADQHFHSAVLLRGGEPLQKEYYGNLVLSLNFLVPFIGGNQAILKTMSLKEATPIETIDLYRELLGKLQIGQAHLPSKIALIKELLTADEKALSEGRPSVVGKTARDVPGSPGIQEAADAFEATEKDGKLAGGEVPPPLAELSEEDTK